jgi:hypothetical protein
VLNLKRFARVIPVVVRDLDENEIPPDPFFSYEMFSEDRVFKPKAMS